MYVVKIVVPPFQPFKFLNDSFFYEVPSKHEERVKEIIELHGSGSFRILFRELIDIIEPSELDISEYENLGLEELRKKCRELQEESASLKSAKKVAEDKASELSKSNLSKKINELNNDVRQLENEVSSKDHSIKRLTKDLEIERNNLNRNYQISETQLSNIRYLNQNLNQENSKLRQENGNLHQKIEKLQKSKSGIEEQKSSINQELEETQKKLNMAMARLHGQTEKSGIAGGGSRSDKLKNDFWNLKRGLFREASNKVLECWKKQDSALNQRSEEFSEIRSVVSRCVFIDGMYIFAGDKSEVNESVKLIINELFSIEELSPTQIQAVQHKVEAVLLKSKSVDGSNEALTSNIEATTNKIQEDLRNIRNVDLSQDVLQEIKKFVEAALKLVREIVNDTPPGEFYTPEVREKFDENSHDTRDEPEGQVKLTICAGYRIPGNILVKADVVTIPETPTPPEEKRICRSRFFRSPQSTKISPRI